MADATADKINEEMLMSRFRLVAVAVLAGSLAACASTATPRPFPSPGRRPPPVPAGSTQSVVRRALDLQGVPYRAGGADPHGFDCSGLVQYVYAQEGVRLPRTVAEQMASSVEIAAEAVAPGDLLFFRVDGSKPSHVGIAVATDAFIHAPRERGVVRVERLGSRYWQQRLIGARRPVSSSVF